MQIRGFTLVELAVVIAIIAILAAVAIPRFGNAVGQSECAKVKNLAASLTSSASIYSAEQNSAPVDFSSFVTNTPAVTAPYTISVSQFGCGTIGPTVSNCDDFRYYDPTYRWTQGVVTLDKPVAKREPNAGDCG